MAATSSAREIQLQYWRPEPIGPPRPSLKSGSILASAPPLVAEHDRRCAGAPPGSRTVGRRRWRPPSARHRSARKDCPGRSAPSAPDRPGRRSSRWRSRTASTVGGRPWRPASRPAAWCPAPGCRRGAASARRSTASSPMPSPARLTTASTPCEVGARRARPAAGSQRDLLGPRRARGARCAPTSCPAAASAWRSAVPISPLDPVMATLHVTLLAMRRVGGRVGRRPYAGAGPDPYAASE